MKGQVVALSHKNPDEERILRWAEGEGKPIIDLADRISRERLELPGPQDTPWGAFENTRAFFERLSERFAKAIRR